MGLAIFGQIFLVFGVAALSAKEKIGWIFVAVGGALCAGGLVHRFADDPEMQAMLVDKVLPVGICSLFPLVGIGMLIYAYKNLIQRKIRCTLPVMAQSTYLDQEVIHVHRGNSDSTTPVLMWVKYYRYHHNGDCYYCDCDAVPASQPQPSLGDYKEIFINPDKPEEYWSNTSGRFEMKIMLFLGIEFTIAGGVALYFMVG